MAQERIEIIITERGAASVASQIEKIGDASEKSIIQTNRLRGALAALTGALGINALKQQLDTYTSMTNRLRVVTTNTAQLRVVQKELFDIAIRSRSAFETVTELYSRMAFATKQVGTSQADLLRVTESLNKAITISGATSIEAKAALIQLSQGLASGRLQGDELRSVLEQMPIVALAISKHMGVAFGDIRKVAKEGKITTEIIVEAIKKAGNDWDKLFAELPPTIEGSLLVVKTRFLQVIGAMDQSIGVSSAVAKGFLFLAKNMDKVVGVAASLATVLGITLARYALDIVVGRLIDFFKLLVVGPIVNFTNAIRTLGGTFVVFGTNVAVGTKALAAFAASSVFAGAGLFGRLITSIGSAVTSFRTLGLAGVLSMSTIAGAARTGAVGLLTLLNPVSLIRGAFIGLSTIVSGGLTAAFATAGAAVSGLLSVVGGAVGVFFGLVKVIGLALVAMYTLGDQTKIAGSEIATYRDVALAAWERIKVGLSALGDYFQAGWARISGYSQDAFKNSNRGFFDYVRDLAKGMDLVVAGFLAAYDTILATWKSFPAALVDLVWQGLKKLWELLKEFVEAAAKFLKDFFYKIISLDFDNISAGGLDTKVEGAAERVFNTYNDFFEQRKGQISTFSDEVNIIEKRTTEIAQEEAAKRIKAAQEEAAERAKLTQQGVKLPGQADTDEKQKRKGFADYLTELQRERDLGLQIGDALKIANEQREIANKLRRDLTESEKAQVAEVVKGNLELERQRQLLEEIKGPKEEYGLQLQALNALYQQGAITLDEFNQKFFQLRENFLNGLPEATTFADGFAIQIQKMQLATRNGFGQMGTEVAKIFGPGGTLVNGIGDAIAQSIVFGKSFKEQIRQVAQSILSQLISSLIKMGLNMVLNAALGNSLMAASTATAVGSATAITAAAAPAAATMSLATGGANAAGATSAISTVFSLLGSLAGSLFGGGFAEGGYTGAVGTKDIAGVVHGQEFVINAAATKRNRSLLEAINAGRDPMAPIVQAAQAPQMNISVTNEIPDAAYEVRHLGESEIEIIAKRVVRREAPEIVANDLRNPNSRVSKGISNNTQAARRR